MGVILESNGRKWCRPCGKMRDTNWSGHTCLVCCQLHDAEPGDECWQCAGEGVLDGLIVDDGPAREFRCPACRGTGAVQFTSCRCGRPAPSGQCSECAERGAAA